MSISSTINSQVIFTDNINNNLISIAYTYKGLDINSIAKYRKLELKKRSTIKNIDRLRKFYQLENNWDGYGAEKIEGDLINFCLKVIRLLDDDKQPLINPTGRNSIQLEYEKEDGTYFELEFFSKNVIVLFRIDNVGNETTITLNSLKEVLGTYFLILINMIDEFVVNDNEILYRSISEVIYPDCKNGVSSSVFKSDHCGLSVDRDGNRSIMEIFTFFLQVNPRTKAMAQIKTIDCRNLDTIVMASPIIGNIYHAEIFDNLEKNKITPSKAKKLSRKSKLIEIPL